MKIRKVLAAAGVVVAVTPAALAAVAMMADRRDGNSGLPDGARDAFGVHQALEEMRQMLLRGSSDPRSDSGEAAESGQGNASGSGRSFAPVIGVALDHDAVGAGLRRALAGDSDPFPATDLLAGIAAPLGDVDGTAAERRIAAVDDRAFSGSYSSSLSTARASSGGVGGAGGGVGGGNGGTGNVNAEDGGQPVRGQQASEAVQGQQVAAAVRGEAQVNAAGAGHAGEVGVPLEPPVAASTAPVNESIAGLDNGKPDGGNGALSMPIPPSVWMLLAATAGLIFLGRRRFTKQP